MNPAMCADRRAKPKNKVSVKGVTCQVPCVACNLSLVTCHLLHVTIANSHSHGPQPANSLYMHSRMQKSSSAVVGIWFVKT